MGPPIITKETTLQAVTVLESLLVSAEPDACECTQQVGWLKDLVFVGPSRRSSSMRWTSSHQKIDSAAMTDLFSKYWAVNATAFAQCVSRLHICMHDTCAHLCIAGTQAIQASEDRKVSPSLNML